MKFIESLKLRWVVWVWNHTPNCAEMSRLASRSFEQPPSLALRLKMRLHHLICVWCQRYERQLQFLHRAAPQTQDELDGLTVRGLSPEARQRLVQRLREANHD
jgi:hypothetical protein